MPFRDGVHNSRAPFTISHYIYILSFTLTRCVLIKTVFLKYFIFIIASLRLYILIKGGFFMYFSYRKIRNEALKIKRKNKRWGNLLPIMFYCKLFFFPSSLFYLRPAFIFIWSYTITRYRYCQFYNPVCEYSRDYSPVNWLYYRNETILRRTWKLI